ncbi:phosphoglycerate mutase-like protein [Artomyces pyxidatus]|uniref:Phosphoglycerate mutase-like protein n=1 Tax=Artomyces pyxidatus TaxID=48021 RepID=A0ACB8SXC6_9AGAM|nr:phosphoglycerate mutase-like protein [Artomyces pyxidatus]
MSHPTVRGVVVITRNGDRVDYYQDPKTYQSAQTDSTPLGEVQSHQLGEYLRKEYFSSSSPSFIHGVSTDLVDLGQVHARIKNGGEGSVVFDSTIALLQGLFPPTSKNSIELANGSLVVAPLGGYQYVPAETVEPSNDRSLESWTDCPNFEAHVEKFYSSDKFKNAEKQAAVFYKEANDFLFGRPATLVNAVFDYMNHELTHNKSYAHRLPPTFIEQARHWANFHEEGVFSESDINGIGNIAGRTLLQSVVNSLERITFDGDPLQFLVESTTYQAFISLFTQTEMIQDDPTLKGIPEFASAIAIELRRGSLPDNRDFLRFKFKNGTDEEFRTLHVFGHKGDIPLTEFIYRVEGSVVSSNRQWLSVCGYKSFGAWTPALPFGIDAMADQRPVATAVYGALFATLLMVFVFAASKLVRRARGKRITLGAMEVHHHHHPPSLLVLSWLTVPWRSSRVVTSPAHYRLSAPHRTSKLSAGFEAFA